MLKKFKTFIKTVKEKKNKTWIYILGILSLINFVAAAYFIYSLVLLSGIETIIRYGIMGFAVIMAFIFLNLYMSAIIKNKNIWNTVYLFFIIASIFAQIFVGYNIIRIYNPISSINKSNITYTSSLIMLSDNESTDIKDIKDMTIGMISKSEGYEDYTIANVIIKENKLKENNKIKEYSDYIEMLNALYAKEIDAVIISSNYKTMFNTIEKFANIENDTKVITSKSKGFEKESTTSISKKNIIKEPFTVLLMGVDSEHDGLDKDAAFNGDSLMLITFNPNTLNTTVLSIPRDTYVPITCFRNQKKNKITHAAWQGVSCMEKTIENFTGIEIDYYVKMNFKGVVDLVDALGGIEVDVPIKFCEQNSDRHWGSSQICLDKGVQTLNGEEALALARHRKTLTLGDIQRGQHQQLVVQGMLNRLSTIDSLDKMNNILNTISKNMDTNISTNQILSFYNVGKDILLKSVHTTTDDLISMEKLYLDGYSKMIYDEGFGLNLSNYVYYKSSLEAVVDAMKVNLELQEPKMTKTFDFSINETYEVKTIGQGEKDSNSTITTLPSFIGDSKEFVTNWANARGIKVTFTEVKKGDQYYKDTYTEGQVASQSVPSGTEMDKIKSISFGIIVKDSETTNDEGICKKGTTNSKCYIPKDIKTWTYKEVSDWSSSLIVSVKLELVNDTYKEDAVVSTINKTPGSLLEEGSTITITFKENTTTTPDENNNNDNNQSNDNTESGENSNDPDSKPIDPNTGIGDNTNLDNEEQAD